MEQRVSIERMEEAINLFGSFDENIRLLEAEFHVTVVNRDGELRISGEPEEVMMAAKAVEALLTLSGKGESIRALLRWRCACLPASLRSCSRGTKSAVRRCRLRPKG